jgi:hypothetical protein
LHFPIISPLTVLLLPYHGLSFDHNIMIYTMHYLWLCLLLWSNCFQYIILKVPQVILQYSKNFCGCYTKSKKYACT